MRSDYNPTRRLHLDTVQYLTLYFWIEMLQDFQISKILEIFKIGGYFDPNLDTWTFETYKVIEERPERKEMLHLVVGDSLNVILNKQYASKKRFY